ncbi:MAG: ankyrin repeat domain-containing protein [Thermoguttaceae bacterium]|nr:ankyrin repeat domain-containing protein [Thermoguttaceae bacterium]
MKTRSKIALFALLSIAIIVLALYCIYGISTRRIHDPEAKGVSTYYYLGEMLVYKSFEKDPVKKRVKVVVKTDPRIDELVKKTRGLFLRDQIVRFERAFATGEFDDCCYHTGIIGYAAYLGDLDRVKKLIHERKKKTHYYEIPVSIAARGGHLEVVQWLVENEGNKYSIGSQVLFDAAESGNLELVKWLIERGAVTKTEKDSFSSADFVILHAAQSGNLKLVQWLNENGEDINVNRSGETIVHYAAQSGNLELVQWLIEKKNLSVDSVAKCGKRPIWFAAPSGNLELVKWMDHHGAFFEPELLTQAAKSGNPKLVQWIFKKASSKPYRGIVIAKEQRILDTALLYAAQSGSLETVQFLLKNGASINAFEDVWRDLNTRTNCGYYWRGDFMRYSDILSCAVDSGNHVLVEWIIDQGFNINSSLALSDAIFNQDYLMVRHLIEKGADIDTFSNYNNPLAMATRRACHIGCNDMRIIKYLVERGAITDVGTYANDPIYSPASNGNLEMVKYLIQHKASGSRALTYAKRSYDKNAGSDDYSPEIDQRLRQTIKWLEDQGFQPETISNE